MNGGNRCARARVLGVLCHPFPSTWSFSTPHTHTRQEAKDSNSRSLEKSVEKRACKPENLLMTPELVPADDHENAAGELSVPAKRWVDLEWLRVILKIKIERGGRLRTGVPRGISLAAGHMGKGRVVRWEREEVRRGGQR